MKQYVESDPDVRIYVGHSVDLCNGHRSQPEIYAAHVYGRIIVFNNRYVQHSGRKVHHKRVFGIH